MENYWLYCIYKNLTTNQSLILKDIIDKNGSFEDDDDYEGHFDTLESYCRVLNESGKIRVNAPYTFENEYNVSLILINKKTHIVSRRKFTDQFGTKHIEKINFAFNSDNYEYFIE